MRTVHYTCMSTVSLQKVTIAVGVQGQGTQMTTKLSFLSCCNAWEKHRILRRRARSRMTLVQDCKGRSHISPSLDNLKVNEPILRPFTIAMAEAGRISKPLKLIKEALVRFYSGEGEEMEETA